MGKVTNKHGEVGTREFSLSRRRVLLGAGAGLGAIAVGSGTAGAEPPERHIVGTATEQATRAAERKADSVYRVLDFGAIGQAVAGTYPEDALDGLRTRPDVRYVEPDGQMHAISIDSNDGEVPWGVDRVDAEKVYPDSTGGGADIAILDTGIDSDHPDLQANLGSGKAFVKSRGPYAESWDDDNGHGTHCAGIADAVDNGEGVVGVSTEATLHAVKVLDKDGTGSWSDIAAGIEYTADQGWHVASMSLGGGRSSTVEDACSYAYDENGVLLVAAAGNDGCSSDYTIDEYSCDGCVSAPAVYKRVIAVSSTAKDDSVSGFSSAGCTVELAAPGSNVYSTYVGGGYDTLSGTSMACPHVSGATALLMATGLSHADDVTDFENPGGARGRLRDTAERETDEGKTLVPSGMARNNLYGFGLLDVEAAVNGSTDGAPSVSWANPTNGDEVSGAVTIKIDAGDSEDSDDSLTVEYRVDDGSWRTASYDLDSGYYEDTWDSTGVGDGDHTLEARATDSDTNTSTAGPITVTVANTESAPTIDTFSLTDDSNPTWTRYYVDWAVSDDDGDLSSVTSEMLDSSDNVLDSDSSSVGGGSASGTHYVEFKGDANEIRLTVTDEAGNSISDTKSI